MSHTLVIYRASGRADAELGELARAVRERGGRLTVLALAVEEPVKRGCCDTRSVLWNRITREIAQKDLARARMVVEDAAEAEAVDNGAEVEVGVRVDGGRDLLDVEFGVLRHTGRRVSEAVEREALRRGADQVVLADPGSCGLSRREQRRLRASALATSPS